MGVKERGRKLKNSEDASRNAEAARLAVGVRLRAASEETNATFSLRLLNAETVKAKSSYYCVVLKMHKESLKPSAKGSHFFLSSNDN